MRREEKRKNRAEREVYCGLKAGEDANEHPASRERRLNDVDRLVCSSRDDHRRRQIHNDDDARLLLLLLLQLLLLLLGLTL